MVQVQGIGGVFFRARDPAALREWYETHLGVAPPPQTAQGAPWLTETGVTVFAPFPEDSEYFPPDRRFMLNFRVADLVAARAELTGAGIDCSDILGMEGVGKFTRIHGPEGNPIELWEPDAD